MHATPCLWVNVHYRAVMLMEKVVATTLLILYINPCRVQIIYIMILMFIIYHCICTKWVRPMNDITIAMQCTNYCLVIAIGLSNDSDYDKMMSIKVAIAKPVVVRSCRMAISKIAIFQLLFLMFTCSSDNTCC